MHTQRNRCLCDCVDAGGVERVPAVHAFGRARPYLSIHVTDPVLFADCDDAASQGSAVDASNGKDIWYGELT